MENWYLVSYDVRDEKRLRQTARKLEGFGERLQDSVFRCRLSERSVERMRWELSMVLAKEDDLLIVRLCPACVQRIRHRRQECGWPAEPGSVIVFPPSSIDG